MTGDPEATMRLQRAEALIQLDRAGEAEQLAREHLVSDPESVPAQQLLARSLVLQRRWEEALPVARAVLHRNPENPDALMLLTHIHLALGEPQWAWSAAREAVRLAPWEPLAWYALANAEPQLPDKLAAAMQAVQLDPQDPDYHNLAGVLLDALNRVDEARAAFHAALRLDPAHAGALNNLATLDASQHRLGSAARGLAASLAVNPHSRGAQSNLDAVMLAMSWRVMISTLAAGAVLGLMLVAQVSWPVRTATGLLLLALIAALARRFLSHLPQGFSMVRSGLWGRSTWNARRVLLLAVVGLVCVAAMAVLPQEAAAGFGMALLFVLRVVGVLVVVGFFVRAVIAVVRRE